MVEFIEINEINIVDYQGDVYDLEVEDDHTYTVDGYIVHNCTTSTNTAINYPQADLITEVYKIKQELSETKEYENKRLPKIVADGGIRNYCDVIKALALGADYVMIGGLFAKMLESASLCQIYTKDGIIEYDGIHLSEESWFKNEGDGHFIMHERPIEIFKKFYGMASILGQKDLKCNLKVPEGIVKTFRVEYTMEEWSKKMIHYLQSAMSYTNSRVVEDLKFAEVIVVSTNAHYAINR